MKSLLETPGNAEMTSRLEALRADSKPRWGKMSAPQMLAHCQKPLLTASGELKLKRGLIGRIFGRMAKKKFVNGAAPFSHNSPTDPRFLVPDARDFEAERQRLVELVKDFQARGPEGITRDPHPFFGPMTVEEWDTLMWKHLDHHLGQFGV